MSQPKAHHYASHRSTKSLDRVAIFWDYESCLPGPGYIPAYTIVDNIRSACLSYGSITTFKAYVERADVYLATESSRPSSLRPQQSHPSLRDQLQLYGVGLSYYPPSMRSTMGERLLLVDMLLFALDNPAPSTTLIIITAEEISPYAISALRLRHYKVVLITPQSAGVNPYPKPAMAAHASEVLDWTSVVSRGRRSPTNTNTGGSSTGTGGTGTSTAATGNDGGSPRSVSTVDSDSLPLSPTMTPVGTSSSGGTVVDTIIPRPISTSSRGSTHHRPHHQGFQPHQSHQSYQGYQVQQPQSSFLQSQSQPFQPHHQHSLSSSSTSSVLTNPLSLTNPTPLFPSFASTFQPFRRGLTPQLGVAGGAGPTSATGAQSTLGRVWGHSGFPSSSSISIPTGLSASATSADRDRERERERERERQRALERERERERERIAEREFDREPRRANSGSTVSGNVGGQPSLNLDTNNSSLVTAGPPSSISNTSSTSSSLSSLTSPQSIAQTSWPLSPPPTIQQQQTPLSGLPQPHPHGQQQLPQLPHSLQPHQHLQHQQSREMREQKEQLTLQAQREREQAQRELQQAQKEQLQRERRSSVGPIAPPISPTDSIVRRPTVTGTGTGPTTTPGTGNVTGFQFITRVSPSSGSIAPAAQQAPQQPQPPPQPPSQPQQMPQMQMPQPQPHHQSHLSHGHSGFSTPFGFSGGRTGSRDDTGPGPGMNLNQPYPPNVGAVGGFVGGPTAPPPPPTRPPHYSQSSHGSHTSSHGQSGHGSYGSVNSGHTSGIDMHHFDLLLNILREFRADNKSRPYRSKIGSELVQRDRLVYQRAGLSGFKEYVGLAEQLGLVRLGGHSGSPGKEWIELVVPPPTLPGAVAGPGAHDNIGAGVGVVGAGTGGGGANS